MPSTFSAVERTPSGARYDLIFDAVGKAKSEIHALLWRPEIFGLTHQLFISNRAKIAQ